MLKRLKRTCSVSVILSATATAKSLESCPTLCNPREGSLPGSPVPGILQARTLEWVAISFSNAWKWTVKLKLLNHVRLLVTPWTAAHQAPPSMGFSRQEYWSGMPLPSPPALAGGLFNNEPPGKPHNQMCACSVMSDSLWVHGCSLPGSSVHGIFQARILEWLAVFSSRESSQPRDWTHISCIGRWILYLLHHLGSPDKSLL